MKRIGKKAYRIAGTNVIVEKRYSKLHRGYIYRPVKKKVM
jgi:hypothetical protein